MTFVQRRLDVEFKLGIDLATGKQNTFDSTGSDTVTLTDLRITAAITQSGGQSQGEADINIFGMTVSVMNKLSTLGLSPRTIGPNFVTLLAGDTETQPSVVFQGAISDAYFDASAMPDVAFRVSAQSGAFTPFSPCPPRSYPEPVSIDAVMGSIAKIMGLTLENKGVTGTIPPTYLYGSSKTQAYAAATAGNFNINFDTPTKMIIFPKGKPATDKIIILSKKTGMVGYPAYVSKGIQVRTIFNPEISYGSTIKIESELLTAANGNWIVFHLAHDLESRQPNGQWFSTIQAYPPGSSFGGPGQNALG